MRIIQRGDTCADDAALSVLAAVDLLVLI